jgi:peptidoglycan/LPS O-acetylase OafA/YrhL
MHVQVSPLLTRQTTYRPDIDGLRAVAVASVLLFHGFPTILPGGFVGVDVFFVISGYLISSQILSEMQQGRFSFASFYARRARRLLPALLLVLTFCVIAGWFILLPSQYKLLGRDTLAGLAFSSNLIFWSDAGYFDAPSATKPLLHLWSLGIEEQFYLLWPIALVMAFRYQRIALLIGAVIAASFACNVLLIATSHQSAAFYLPFSRFWELLAGAAIVNIRGKSEISAIVGAVMIVLSIALVQETQFPGWQALLPVFGTVLMIVGGHEALINRVLSHRVIVAIGLISYPLYLWHWPLLTFVRIKNAMPLTIAETLLILLTSGALAAVNYLVIERPIRASRLRYHLLRPGIAFVSALLAFGFFITTTRGFPQRLPEAVRDLASAKLDRSAWRDGTCFLSIAGGDFAADCTDQLPQGSPRLVLWGDSHGAMLYPGFLALKQKRGFRLSQFTSSSCPPILAMERDPPDVKNCISDNESTFATIAKLSPDVVVLAAYWGKYDLTLLPDTIKAIQNATKARVILIGPFPDWGMGGNIDERLTRAYASTGIIPERIRPESQDRTIALERHVRSLAKIGGADYVSALDFFCNSDGCLTIVGAGLGDLTSFDEAHLNPPAARAFVAASMAIITESMTREKVR